MTQLWFIAVRSDGKAVLVKLRVNINTTQLLGFVWFYVQSYRFPVYSHSRRSPWRSRVACSAVCSGKIGVCIEEHTLGVGTPKSGLRLSRDPAMVRSAYNYRVVTCRRS